MKRIEEELRNIRQQMEEDFLLHSERISAQNQSVERVERALETVGERLEQVESGLAQVWEAVGSTRESVSHLKREFHDFSREMYDFSHTTRATNDTWNLERNRNLRMLDAIQTGMLTGGLETESRLDNIERRLSRLEEGAA